MTSELTSNKSESVRPGRYKYERLRERLRLAVTSGELAGKLPGERELARRYQANAKTVNKALSDLATDGLLVRHVGRGTFVADVDPNQNGSKHTTMRIGWVEASSHPSSKSMYPQAISLFTEQGHRLDSLNVHLDEDGCVACSTLPPSLSRDLDGVVLYSSKPSTDLLADLHRRHIPTLLVNQSHDRIKTPLVISDYSQGAFELCEQLIRLGHRDIRMIIGEQMSTHTDHVRTGFEAAMTRHGLCAVPPMNIAHHFDWTSLLNAKPRPSAILCVGGDVLNQAVDHLTRFGLIDSEAMSLCALCEPGDNIPASHSITSYDVQVDRVLHWMVELLTSASPGQLPRTAVVPGRLVDRSSITSPAMPSTVQKSSPREVVI